MANINKPFGLRPVGNLSATGAQKQYGYQIADNQAGAIYQGDLVIVYDGFIIKYDAANAAHPAPTGVFNGCQYYDPTRAGKPTWKNFYPGSIDITQGIIACEVLDDPSQLFLVQADGAVTQANIGKNADPTASTSGSVTTGVSAGSLSSASIAKDAALTFKIIGISEQPDNELGTYTVVVVKLNQHQYGSVGVASAGA
jgi:hypothetical protein